MPTSLISTGVQFPDNSIQTTAAGASGGDYIMKAYVSPATWTKPAGLKAVKVTVVGAGGAGGSVTSSVNTNASSGGGGGGGGTAIRYIDAPAIPGPVAVTAGPGTNSFGSFASATAGSAGGSTTGITTAAGGSAGSGSSGTINIPGSAGQGSFGPAQGDRSGGGGSGSAFASTTYPIVFPASTGLSTSVYGGGGGGAAWRPAGSPGTNAGGSAGTGIVIVEEYY